MSNPYIYLDDPLAPNRYEHIAECNAGMAIPWLSDNPTDSMREAETGPTMRQRLSSLAP